MDGSAFDEKALKLLDYSKQKRQEKLQEDIADMLDSKRGTGRLLTDKTMKKVGKRNTHSGMIIEEKGRLADYLLFIVQGCHK